jgi:hypothetical protein
MVLFFKLFQPAELGGIEPTVFLFPVVERLLRDPSFLITSCTDVPVSACFRAKAIGSSVNFVFFMAKISSFRVVILPEIPSVHLASLLGEGQ